MWSPAAVIAIAGICAIGASAGCASSPKGQSTAECLRALDSADARLDTTTHFPSQIRRDSTMKPGEVEGVVVSALTDSAVSSAQLVLHEPDRAQPSGQIADIEGRFHVLRRAPGRFVIEARRIGYKTDSVVLDAPEGSSVKIALRVNPVRISAACCRAPKGSICI